MVSDPPPTLSQSVVRALLITDLVDSTRIVEQLGDRRAAGVLAQDEAAARQIARAFDGREIDKSDGFLFLFEHAWQAVGFALDYHAALAALSQDLPLPLAARIGIHVGEVYLSGNTPEAVAAGAKPLEVNGIAKSITARLMSAAHGGQTLVSGTTYELAVRPAAELLESGAPRWIDHGDFLLKGAEGPVRVHEVAADAAPIGAAPVESDKVQSVRRRSRRRFLAAAAGVGAVAALPGGWWLWQRSRIPFASSGWLVLADWRPRDPSNELADVVGTAFRIALQQSRFAYVMDPAAVRDALQRMRRAPNAPVDREAAIEIARREAAAVVIDPSISALGAGYLLSAELIEAASGRVLRGTQTQIGRVDQLTQGLDRLATAIRSTLGEPDVAIMRDNAPLAKVTTANFDALRMYSSAEVAYQQGDPEEAIRLLEQAIAIDPEFGHAHAKLGTMRNVLRHDIARVTAHWQRALELSDRLSRREQLYVQGCVSNAGSPQEMLSSWNAMHVQFPDDPAAANNVAWIQWSQFGELRAAENALRISSAINHTWRFLAWHHLGYVLLGQGQLAEALTSFEKGLALDNPSHFGAVRGQLAAGDAEAALAIIRRYPDARSPAFETDRGSAEVLVHAFRRDPEQALAVADGLLDKSIGWNYRDAERIALRCRFLLLGEIGDASRQREAMESWLRVVRYEVDQGTGGAMTLPLLDLAQICANAWRLGWHEAAGQTRALLHLQGRWSKFPVLQAAVQLADGWEALSRGDADAALRIARQARAQLPLFQLLELEVNALRALGQVAEAETRRRHAAERIHVALGESYSFFSTQLANLLAWQRLSA